MNKLILGNSLKELKGLEDNSVDSIVTDPPYELGFMGKKWDNTGIANNVELWAECLRVLKPGGHLLAFSGTRTYHRMAVAIEDAGFEVRDMIEWVYGSGFPKSLNVGKAIEGKLELGSSNTQHIRKLKGIVTEQNNAWDELNYKNGKRNKVYKQFKTEVEYQNQISKDWSGYGTALKPAHEPICMARKPLAEKNIAENVLKWGTGGINIDESRVGDELRHNPSAGNKELENRYTVTPISKHGETDGRDAIGRFPANLIHDNSDEVRECFPETGKGNGKGVYNYNGTEYNNKDTSMFNGDKPQAPSNFNDSGSASRFFKSIIYNPKASKAERNKGCEGLEERDRKEEWGDKFGAVDRRLKTKNQSTGTFKNHHPTVKPIALMEYLIKMVTPKGGTVLDPFMGSGSTGVAAKKNGYDFIGIDMTPEYIEIAKARINHYENPSN